MMEHKKGKMFNPVDSFSPILPDPNAIAGGASGAAPVKTRKLNEVEKAFEQVRKESQGLTREQRREQMRQQGQEEFNRVQSQTDAEWAAELNKIQDALRRGR